MASGFRSSIWDPVLILGQIVSMQCFFYVSLGVLFVAAGIFTGTQKSLDQLLSYHVRTVTTVDIIIILCNDFGYEGV